MQKWLIWLCLLAWLGCDGSARRDAAKGENAEALAASVVPFSVRAGQKGLLLVWYGADGKPHTATRIADVPAEERAQVRVDSLELAPEQRAQPGYVYVADLRSPGADGSFPVKRLRREAFAKSVMPATPEPQVEQAGADSAEVVIYGASWCGACKQAAGYFRQKGIPFVERDIEKDPAARREMLAKAKRQGINPSGIPVIDVKGTLVGGFSAARVESLLASK